MKKFEEDLTMELGETKTMQIEGFSKIILYDLIEDAMRTKDRSVSIYIGEHGVSISVYPLKDEDE